MADVIVWEEPPPIGREGGGPNVIPWSAIAVALRERPREWGRVVGWEKVDPSGVNRIHKGYSRWFRPAGTFEACARGNALYVRYIGEESPSA